MRRADLLLHRQRLPRARGEWPSIPVAAVLNSSGDDFAPPGAPAEHDSPGTSIG